MKKPIKLSKLFVVVTSVEVVDPNAFAFLSKADATRYMKENWDASEIQEQGIEVMSLAEILDCV